MASSPFSWGKFCYTVQQAEAGLAFDRLPPAAQATWERAAQAILLLLGGRIQFLDETIQNDPDLDPESVEFTLALLALVQGVLAEPPRDSDVNRCKAILDTEASSPSDTTAAEASAPRATSACRGQETVECSSCVSPMARTAPPPA
jgi:hypothetical protein